LQPNKNILSKPVWYSGYMHLLATPMIHFYCAKSEDSGGGQTPQTYRDRCKRVLFTDLRLVPLTFCYDFINTCYMPLVHCNAEFNLSN